MKYGFYILLVTQFLSGIADSALLIAAIALLIELQSPHWMTPLLKLGFNASYVLLAVFAGSFADSLPKGRVMLGMNAVKAIGCLSMLISPHPLVSYAIVGFGAASYSPAKTGLVTELVPPDRLVAANGWMEGSAVASIILGTVLGGLLIQPRTLTLMLGADLVPEGLGIDTPAEAAILIIAAIYALSIAINLKVPESGARRSRLASRPMQLLANFCRSSGRLWKDGQARISLAATSLFWGAGATLQFLFLDWAAKVLRMPLGKAAMIQGAFATGTAVGALAAARHVPLNRAFSVLPWGVVAGILIMLLTIVKTVWAAYLLLTAVGLISGFFVVPMNAVLQRRGLLIVNAGQSIAIQNFNENVSVLAMLAAYSVMARFNVPVNVSLIAFGMFVLAGMAWILYLASQNRPDACDEPAAAGR